MPRFKSLPYRPCVGMAVFNRKGRVFIGRRIDGPEYVDDTHAWQLPQGGIDRGEDPWPAALRELDEIMEKQFSGGNGNISGFNVGSGKEAGKKIQPEDIANVVAMLVIQAPQSFVSEVLIRPTQKP